jgi:hypothetical protein
MLFTASAVTSFAPTVQPSRTVASCGPTMSAKSDLEAFAVECNPIIGYWDPLGLADLDFWDQGNDATIGFLRHAEIKHGRVAMAGFVGYCLHANGVTFPFAGPQSVVEAGASPAEVWDQIPFAAKLQIIGFVGVLEHVSEDKSFLAADGTTHYMRGGKPGYFPSFKANVHPCPLNLFDPFGFTKKLSEEAKSKKLVAEVNNGRLAMLGLFGFLAESKVPGSVPALTGLIKPYAGDYMQPFAPTGPDAYDLWTVGNIWSNL